MSDKRKLQPKPGQHLGKRVRNPKKTPKGSNPPVLRTRQPDYGPLAEWERELLGIRPPAQSRRPRR